MTFILRKAHTDEAQALTALCLRSKAYWGYDADFMAACVDELTVTQDDIHGQVIVAAERDVVLGVAEVGPLGQNADLLRLFVAPEAMGRGVGRALFGWCADAARAMSADHLMIEADPGAEAFTPGWVRSAAEKPRPARSPDAFFPCCATGSDPKAPATQAPRKAKSPVARPR